MSHAGLVTFTNAFLVLASINKMLVNSEQNTKQTPSASSVLFLCLIWFQKSSYLHREPLIELQWT